MISTNIITILKKIINDYCKLTNNNDIKENLLISILINIQNASQDILFNHYVIARTIYDSLSEYKNFNSEILLKICKKNIYLCYFEEFDNFLIRHQIKGSFVKNLKQLSNRSLADLMLTIQPIGYIDQAFPWYFTTENHDYWDKYSRMWRTYVRNESKNLCEIQQFDTHKIYNSICDYLSNKNIQ